MIRSWVFDEAQGRLVPAHEYYSSRVSQHRTGSPMIILDLAPHEACISPVDGSLLTSREDIRQHNSRNGVADVGDDPAFKNPKKPEVKRESAKPLIAAIMRGDVPIAKPVGSPDG